MGDLASSIWAPELVSCARQSVSRVIHCRQKNTPQLSLKVLEWLATRCDLEEPEKYFLLPGALPLFSLPWWLEQSLRGHVDVVFQSRLMESSTNLYYFARTLDDVMDGHRVEKAVLPALYPFLLEFQTAFFELFPPSEDFWIHFRRYMEEIAEVTSVEVSTVEFDELAFAKIAARKPVAALVPVAAVCCRYGRQDALAAWEDFFQTFACWHQFRDDLFDWSDDAEQGVDTWLLAEAERRKHSRESVAMWMGREGFDWAGQQLARWMGEMKQKASALNCPELLRYLDLRERDCTAEVAFLTRSAAAWARLLELSPANG